MSGVDVPKILKALGNKTRLQILQWLKDPEANFPPHTELGHFDYGVCVTYIQKKAQLSQSAISHYLAILNDAGLVMATRVGKWTYYKRNEEAITAFVEGLRERL